jgi:hypothetical protein
MGRLRVAALFNCVILLALGLSRPARAQGDAQQTESIHVEYATIAGCPTFAEFEQQFSALTKRVQLTSAAAEQSLRVHFRREGKQYVGRVDAKRPKLARRVQAPVCEDAAKALALVTAIAFDPEAHLPEPEPAVPANSPEPSSAADTPSESPSAAQPTKPPAAKPASSTPARPAQPKASNPKSNEARKAPELRDSGSFAPAARGAYWFGVAGLLRGGDERGVGLGGALQGEWRGGDPLAQALVELAAVTSTRNFDVGSARFTLARSLVAWCPRLVSAHRLDASVCAGAEGGVLVNRAYTGTRLTALDARLRPYLAASGALQGAWRFASSWMLTARGRAAWLPIRDTFLVQTASGNERPVFRSGTASFEGSLGVMYEF